MWRRDRPALDPPLVVLTPLAIVLATFPAIIVPVNEHPKFYLRVLVLLADPLLALIFALLIARTLTRRVSLPSSVWLAGAAVAWMAISLAVHFGPLGTQLVARQIAMVAIASVVAAIARPAERLIVAGGAAAAAIVQGALAGAQILSGHPLGLPQLGEFADELLRVGASVAPRGTMYHPYLLAGLALVGAGTCVLAAFASRRPAPWLVAAAIAIAPVGVTYSRTAALGLALACACLAPGALRGSMRHRAAILALVLGAGIPAALAPDGWGARVELSVTRVPDRPTLIGQALRITAAEPILGVGPGGYDKALEDLRARDPGAVAVLQEPHIVPVLLAAEGGVVAGVAFLVAVLLLLREAWRAGPETLAAYALFAPFLFLEHYPYTHAQGAVILGTWFGVVAAWSRPAAAGQEEAPR